MNERMKTLVVIRKTREYLDYLEEHVTNVARAWEAITAACKDIRFVSDDYVWNSICDAVQHHDMSKMSAEEFTEYRQAFYPTDVEDKIALDESWAHHKDHNPHHWENWTAKEYYNPFEAEMHCVHMVVDWTAMGYKFGDTAQQYYESHPEINLPEWAVTFIYEIFERLAKTEEPPCPN